MHGKKEAKRDNILLKIEKFCDKLPQPAMTQLFYRIGDSTTNCFTPFMPYLWVALKSGQDMFDPKLKLGTLVSNLFPIGMVLLIMWIIFLVAWMMLGLPIGPGVTTYVSF